MSDYGFRLELVACEGGYALLGNSLVDVGMRVQCGGFGFQSFGFVVGDPGFGFWDSGLGFRVHG